MDKGGSSSDNNDSPVGLSTVAPAALGRTAWPPHPPVTPISLLQIDAASLIAASVMAAPCALALSKLVYPEVEESKFRNKEGVQLSSG